MPYKTIYSSDLTTEKIRLKFLSAKYDRNRCDFCNSVNVYYINDEKTKFRCRDCWRTFSLSSHTYLENTKLDLRFWYEVIWCFVIGHSANKAHKLLGTKRHQKVLRSYQTIREALLDYSQASWEKSQGIYETDEALYGGEWGNLRKYVKKRLREEGKAKRGRGAKERKQPVFGIYKRDDEKVYLELIDDFSADTLEPIIEEAIEEESEIFSDTWKGYNGLAGLGYLHSRVSHGKEEYVSGEVHINGIEGFWGLSKTNMHTYKGIRKKNWKYYLKEMEFRYNYRNLDFDEQVDKIIQILMREPA
jgi:transposase-like protein